MKDQRRSPDSRRQTIRDPPRSGFRAVDVRVTPAAPRRAGNTRRWRSRRPCVLAASAGHRRSAVSHATQMRRPSGAARIVKPRASRSMVRATTRRGGRKQSRMAHSSTTMTQLRDSLVGRALRRCGRIGLACLAGAAGLAVFVLVLMLASVNGVTVLHRSTLAVAGGLGLLVAVGVFRAIDKIGLLPDDSESHDGTRPETSVTCQVARCRPHSRSPGSRDVHPDRTSSMADERRRDARGPLQSRRFFRRCGVPNGIRGLSEAPDSRTA